jgi:hypothetical protein
MSLPGIGQQAFLIFVPGAERRNESRKFPGPPLTAERPDPPGPPNRAAGEQRSKTWAEGVVRERQFLVSRDSGPTPVRCTAAKVAARVRIPLGAPGCSILQSC